MNPLVTIVIPVYNGENYLAEAINSALNQDYENIEILVVNDGSNDSGATRSVALSYGTRIRFFEKENGGVASALNMAIKNMNGQYFSWLSHDDKYKINKISTQIDFLKSNTSKVIPFSDYDLINDKSKLINGIKLDHDLLERKDLYAIFRGCLNGCTLLLPKECFSIIGYFDESLKYTQDYDYWFRLSKFYKFSHINQSLVETRIHPEQDSKKDDKSIPECDDLWSNMISNLSFDQIRSMEETKLKFLTGMSFFLRYTPYKGAFSIVEKDLIELKKSVKGQTPLVTVIIPFYNRIKYTVRAIQSIINQTYSNWELILINDGSTDDISDINSLIETNLKIRIYNQANHGVSKARNLGIEYAKGDYIAFLDSDDEFETNKIDRQLSYMLETGSYFSHTSYSSINESKKELQLSGTFHGRVFPQIISCCPIATPTIMIHASILNGNSLFNEEIHFGEDVCAWVGLSTRFDLVGINESLTNVYVNESSAAVNVEKQIKGLENIIEYVQKNEFTRNKYDHLSRLFGSLSHYYGILGNVDRKHEFSYLLELIRNKYVRKFLKVGNKLLFSLNYIYKIVKR